MERPEEFWKFLSADVPIANSYDVVTVSFECPSTLSIVLRPIGKGMNRSIDFEDQLEFSTIEVGHKTMEHVLSTEFEAQASAIAQQRPRSRLSASGASAHEFGRDELDTGIGPGSHGFSLQTLPPLAGESVTRIARAGSKTRAPPLQLCWSGGRGVRHSEDFDLLLAVDSQIEPVPHHDTLL